MTFKIFSGLRYFDFSNLLKKEETTLCSPPFYFWIIFSVVGCRDELFLAFLVSELLTGEAGM